MSRSRKSDFEQFFQDKWIDPACIEEKIADLKKQGRTIATLNGSFDLLHAGHLQIIYEGSLQADVLVVALNSDSSIRQYKSPYRPIIALEHRLRMMAALAFVDFVTSFEETDPRALLSKIKPDVHVNGAEYGQDCIEAEVVRANGGRIHIVSLVPGLSTSAILKKVRQTEAFFTIPTQESGERGKARSKRSAPNDESIAVSAIDDEEDRSGKAAASRLPVGIVKKAQICD